MPYYIILLIVCFFTSFASSNPPAIAEEIATTSNPVEAGSVHWSRDLDSALLQSKTTGTPLFVLFQEIPGCIGCRTFGSEVLSEPLLVEAIENEFIPVLVYNNRPDSKDALWLGRYREPSWNYQVIRFLDGRGKDIIPRKDRVWTVSGVASRMIESLQTVGRDVPLYLRALHLEHDTAQHGVAGFAMACFWTGEYELGGIEGVIATEAGWYDNRKITLVTYHKEIVSLQQLTEQAARLRCAQKIYLPEDERRTEKIDKTRLSIKAFTPEKYRKAPQKDQKKQLQSWDAIGKITTLTPMQATKMNSLAPSSKVKAIKWLSPSQQQKLAAE